MQPDSTNPWLEYPMGPNLRHFLDIDETQYRGEASESITPEQSQAFSAFLRSEFSKAQQLSSNEVIDLMEELTAMKLPEVTIHLAECYPAATYSNDFRGLLNLGSALMLEAEYEDAIEAMTAAHNLEPDELAPYINLALLFQKTNVLELALNWAQLGLKKEPNAQRLWQIVATLFPELPDEERGQTIKRLARKLNSFNGLSLAAELLSPNDPLLKLEFLDQHYLEGGREPDFLIEYTGLLGMAGKFKNIPQVLWEAETNASNNPIRWQVYLHSAQSYLAENQEEAAIPSLKKMISFDDCPDHIRQTAKAMIADITDKAANSTDQPTLLH